jgi:hypothetical protein
MARASLIDRFDIARRMVMRFAVRGRITAAKERWMLRVAALATIAVLGPCGPISAGVLSETDIQHVRYYQRVVIPADREIPALRDMEAQAKSLMKVADRSGQALDDVSRSEFRLAMGALPSTGGPTLEKMVAALRSIEDPGIFSPQEWVGMLTEATAEIEERLAYDVKLLKAYQKSATSAFQVLVPPHDERSDAPDHWARFQSIYSRLQ